MDTQLQNTPKLSDVLPMIAQGAINIDEGHTVIEPGSRVHRAMHDICRIVHEQSVDPTAQSAEQIITDTRLLCSDVIGDMTGIELQSRQGQRVKALHDQCAAWLKGAPLVEGGAA